MQRISGARTSFKWHFGHLVVWYGMCHLQLARTHEWDIIRSGTAHHIYVDYLSRIYGKLNANYFDQGNGKRRPNATLSVCVCVFAMFQLHRPTESQKTIVFKAQARNSFFFNLLGPPWGASLHLSHHYVQYSVHAAAQMANQSRIYDRQYDHTSNIRAAHSFVAAE